jgi:DNA-binding transcriptional MocR family regulator
MSKVAADCHFCWHSRFPREQYKEQYKSIGREVNVATKPIKRPRAAPAQPLAIQLSDSDTRPLFVQIRENILERIDEQILKKGMRLPPVRDLAKQLGVNQITVARAYRDLSNANFIEGRRGGGSFVLRGNVRHANGGHKPQDVSRPLLAERLYELAHAPGVIAFTSNYPRVEKDAAELLSRCVREAADVELGGCLQYDPPIGRFRLRKALQDYLARQAIKANAEHILITDGAQQALDLAIRTLIAPGDTVVVEQPAYYGVLNPLRGAGARIVEVPLDPDGLDLALVKQLFQRQKIKLVCTNPTFQNPSGVTLSLEKRRELLNLCRAHGVLLLEDDHSPELRFRGRPLPSIRSLAEDGEGVLYARGFGKVFLPGMRIGCLVAPSKLIPKLLAAKAQSDLHSNGLIQEAVARYLAKDDLAARAARLAKVYSSRQRILYEGLRDRMPHGTEINRPDGGLSLWVTLPSDADLSELYFRAVRRGVAFVSGDVFYASPALAHSLRISFGLNDPDEFEEGVSRLCFVIKDLIARPAGRTAAMT